ncbi:hypothetical protein D3C84_383090 [compost metagenome]
MKYPDMPIPKDRLPENIGILMKKEPIIVPPVAISYSVPELNLPVTAVGPVFLNKTIKTVSFIKKTIPTEWKESRPFAADVAVT